MPWIKGDYPVSMKNLDVQVREKAVEIANAILAENGDEGRAIAIGIAKAKEWQSHHPNGGHAEEPVGRVPADSLKEQALSKHAKREDGNLHIVPHASGWAVRFENEDAPRHMLATKAEAVKKAQELASEQRICAIIHRKDGTIETSHRLD
jgi:uncharacterized protein YdaT